MCRDLKWVHYIENITIVKQVKGTLLVKKTWQKWRLDLVNQLAKKIGLQNVGHRMEKYLYL